MGRRSAAYRRFVASMNIGYDQWHDGEPYDCAALAEVQPSERAELEQLLIGRRNGDWRDAEALAAIGSAKAFEALEDSTRGPNREVRLRASALLFAAGRLASLDDAITEGLRFGELGDGLAEAERLAEEHPTPAVRGALLEGALCSRDGRAVRFVALLYFLHGKAPEAFDWSQRDQFLTFHSHDPAERRTLFDAMCAHLGIDGSAVRCPPA